MIDPIAMEAKIDALEAENKRLRDLLKQCEDAVWSAGYEQLWDSIRSVRKADSGITIEEVEG